MRTGTRLEYSERIELAISFVLDRLDSPPSPVEIADSAGFSRHHFGRVFFFAVGESIGEFSRRLRLERSAWMLANSTNSITEIAFEAGYESLEGFGRAFREWYHVTPSDFRSQPSRHEIQSSCQVHWCPEGRRTSPVLVLNKESFMQAHIQSISSKRLIALRHIGPYEEISPKFGQLMGWVNQHQIPMGMGIAIYHDFPDQVAAQDLRSDACMEVNSDFVLPSTDGLDIRVETLAGGDYAVATHHGSYTGLGDAWARFMGQAIPALGRELDDAPPFEIYLNNCMVVPEDELRTDLYMKVK
jgi:AraC family transcriptional regulator